MMKKIMIICLLTLSLLIFSQNNEAITKDGRTVIINDDGTWQYKDIITNTDAFDIRKANWYMTTEQVKLSETFKWEESTIDSNTKYLVATTDFLGDEALLVYYFNLDRLFEVRYVITEKHTNKTDYWSDYKKYVSALKGKYGQTLMNYDGSPIWKDDLYEDDPSEWGMAIAVGDMAALASWETDTTSISALIQGDNYDITTIISFSSKDFVKIEAEKTQQF